MNLFAWAQENLLQPVIDDQVGVPITYHSWVTGESYELRGTVYPTRGEAETEEGHVFTLDIRDVRIRISQLPVAPNTRDKIQWVNPRGVTEQLMLLNEAGAKAIERDEQTVTYLLHCKEIPDDEQTQVLYGNDVGFSYGNADPEGTGFGSPSR